MAGHNAVFTSLQEALAHAERANVGKKSAKRHKVFRVTCRGRGEVFFVVHNQGQVEAMGFVGDRYGMRADPWSLEAEQELQRQREQDWLRREDFIYSLSPEQADVFEALLKQRKASENRP